MADSNDDEKNGSGHWHGRIRDGGDDSYVYRFDRTSEAVAASHQREIDTAKAIAKLGEAFENSNKMFSAHMDDQRRETANIVSMINDIATIAKRNAERISDIELDQAKKQAVFEAQEQARKALEARWRWVHAIFGGTMTALLIAAFNILKDLIHFGAKPSAAAIILLPPAFVFGVPVGAHAATYYVSETGNDAASGSIDAPWATINAAAARATSPGDVVVIQTGTYAESVRLDSSGTPAGPIAFMADQFGGAKIVPPPGNVSQTAVAISGDFVTVEGVYVDGAVLPGAAVAWKKGIEVDGSYNSVRGSTVTNIGLTESCDASGFGIGATVSAEYARFSANTVSDIGPSGGC